MRWSDEKRARMASTAVRAAHELLHTFECIELRDMAEALTAAHLAGDDLAELLGDFEREEDTS